MNNQPIQKNISFHFLDRYLFFLCDTVCEKTMSLSVYEQLLTYSLETLHFSKSPIMSSEVYHKFCTNLR